MLLTGRLRSVAMNATEGSPRSVAGRFAPALGALAAIALMGLFIALAPRGASLRMEPDAPGLASSDMTGDESGLTWDSVTGPDGIVRVETLLAAQDRFVVISGPLQGGATLWSTSDGTHWAPSPVAGSPYGIVSDADDVVAFREDVGFRFSWDEDRWIRTEAIDLPTYVRSASYSGRPGLVYTERGVFAHSLEGELYFSANGTDFELVIGPGVWSQPNDDIWERFTAPLTPTGCNPPAAGAPDYPPLVATDRGFLAFIPANKTGAGRVWPVCDPELWESPDGLTWNATQEASPFAAQSFVYDVAAREEIIIAVGGGPGGRPGAWLTNNGEDWRGVVAQLGAPDGFVLTQVAAGELGWIILGESVTGAERRSWYSPDGSCWHALPSGVTGQIAVVGSAHVMLATRGVAGRIWVGQPDPDAVAGCSATAG